MSFNMQYFAANGGISIQLFQDILYRLDIRTKVVGFGHNLGQVSSYICFENPRFKIVPNGQEPPEITPIMGRDLNGRATCLSVDISAALDPALVPAPTTFALPSGTGKYLVSGHVVGEWTPPDSPTCAHTWQSYTGMRETYEFCTFCGVKK
jgi:hypothetical protein